jgi:hypothetical protein
MIYFTFTFAVSLSATTIPAFKEKVFLPKEALGVISSLSKLETANLNDDVSVEEESAIVLILVIPVL